jgi:transcriptional regulator of acetoin/glycerol metabolism
MSLLRHDWPDNIRELALTVERACAAPRNGDGEIAGLDIPEPRLRDASDSRSQMKRRIITQLVATQGNVAKAARRLGWKRPLVYHWLDRLEIDPAAFRAK